MESGGEQPSRSELAERVERLESLVAQLAPTGPTRRRVLGGLAVLGTGALLGGGAQRVTAAPSGSFVEAGQVRGPNNTKRFDLGATTTYHGTELDLSNPDKLGLPERSSDPSASAGDLWYRTDLD
jgi:hypothetical protein